VQPKFRDLNKIQSTLWSLLYSKHYNIVLNKIRNGIWTVCITGRRGIEGAFKIVCG